MKSLMRPGTGDHSLWMTPSALITVLNRIGDNAHGEQIVDLFERDLLFLELLINRVRALDPRVHARRNAFAPQFRLHRAPHAFEIFFVRRALRFDGFRNFRESFGIEIPERKVFQFAAHFAHAEPVRDGSVDLERLARDSLLPLGAQARQRAHIVQPVGQLDDDHADVVDHRQQHLAVVLRLAILGRVEVDLAQLGDAVDAARHFIAEVLLDIRRGDAGVFHDVVQQPGLDADRVHAHARKDPAPPPAGGTCTARPKRVSVPRDTATRNDRPSRWATGRLSDVLHEARKAMLRGRVFRRDRRAFQCPEAAQSVLRWLRDRIPEALYYSTGVARLTPGSLWGGMLSRARLLIALPLVAPHKGRKQKRDGPKPVPRYSEPVNSTRSVPRPPISSQPSS